MVTEIGSGFSMERDNQEHVLKCARVEDNVPTVRCLSSTVLAPHVPHAVDTTTPCTPMAAMSYAPHTPAAMPPPQPSQPLHHSAVRPPAPLAQAMTPPAGCQSYYSPNTISFMGAEHYSGVQELSTGSAWREYP